MSETYNTRALLNKLSRNLGTVKFMISDENRSNDYSLNIIMETVAQKIFNITFENNFENANLIERNFPGIDLVDEKAKTIAQVTSTFDTEKIAHTIEQVISKNLYTSYKRLIFVFLSDKRKLRKDFADKINKLIDGKFEFSFDKDIYDLKDISVYHRTIQDVDKTLRVVKVLDELLSDSPTAGFDAVMVCFDEEEIENTFCLVDAIIKKGMNVYITSKLLYNRFIDQKHPNNDYLVLVNSSQSVDNVNFCITVLSYGFIAQAMNLNSPNTCRLFRYSVEKEIKTEFIAFPKANLKDLKKLQFYKRKGYRSGDRETITLTVEKILADKEKEAAFRDISVDEVKEELINTNRNFQSELIYSDRDCRLLRLTMPVHTSIELNYLILCKDCKLPEVVANLTANCNLKSLKNLDVLILKDFDQKRLRTIDTARKAFDIESVYFVDEYLYDKRFGQWRQSPIINTEQFVSPVIRHNNQHLQLNDIIHWIFNNSDSSIAIISGLGGIGKTTVCEKIHDLLIDDDERNIVIFISASQYISVFKNKEYSEGAEYDLYNIFNSCHPDARIFDKTSFYLNHSMGNVIVIFDGIDEIISTIPSFTLQKFRQNLEKLRLTIGKGKILINCRDTYISELKDSYDTEALKNIQVYELLPFNEELAKTFFSKHFNSADSIQNCLRLVKEFYPKPESNGAYIYPPFILEIVVEVVKSNFEYSEINSDFNSEILRRDEFNDVVIYRICNREFIKKEKLGFQLAIDKQVQFLCEFAIEEKGRIFETDFERLLENIGIKDRVEEVSSGLKDHPLIYKTDNYYSFRFEFFNNYFKSITIFNMLCTDISIPITERLINILAFDCNYDSEISKMLILKADECQIPFSDCLKYSKEIIKKIHSYQPQNIKFQERKNKAISNILLVILIAKYPTKTNEYILNYLFTNREGEIENFYFIDVPASVKITFNLSNLYFKKCIIANYEHFFNCEFNKDTFFDESCYISKVYSQKINLKNIKASIDNFDRNIKGDNSVFRIMSIKGNEKDLVRYFREYLNFFFIGRRFKTQCLLSDILIHGDEFINSKMLTEILNRHEIVKEFVAETVIIDESFKFKIIRFLGQGLLFSQLDHSVAELKNLILNRK